MTTAAELFDAIVELGNTLDAQPIEEPHFLIVDPRFTGAVRRARGLPMEATPRRRGIRGRKRALMQHWVPGYVLKDVFKPVRAEGCIGQIEGFSIHVHTRI